MLMIWKFPLLMSDMDINNELLVEMPAEARLLTVQTQRGESCLWALISNRAKIVKRRLLISGTGHELPAIGPVPNEALAARYVGTFQLEGGALVYHVFDLGEEE